MMVGIVIMHSSATKIHCFLCNFFYRSGLPLDAFLPVSGKKILGRYIIVAAINLPGVMKTGLANIL